MSELTGSQSPGRGPAHYCHLGPGPSTTPIPSALLLWAGSTLGTWPYPASSSAPACGRGGDGSEESALAVDSGLPRRAGMEDLEPLDCTVAVRALRS